MMELGALIVFLAVFAGCGVVVFAVSFFGTQSETFEEALEKQRSQQKKEKEKKSKPAADKKKKPKKGKEAKNNNVTDFEEEAVLVDPAGEIVEPVFIEPVKVEPKVEEVKIEKPKKEEKKEKKEEKVVAKAVVPPPAPVPEEVVPVKAASVAVEAAPVVVEPVIAAPVQEPAPDVPKPEKKKIEIQEVVAVEEKKPKKSAKAAKQSKKSNYDEVLETVRKVQLSSSEVQGIVDVLLLKQTGADGEDDGDWEEQGKETEAKKSARQLAELTEQLEEEKNKSSGLEKKMATLRKEMTDNKSQLTVVKRELEEVNRKKTLETNNYNTTLQQLKVELNTSQTYHIQMEAKYQQEIRTIKEQLASAQQNAAPTDSNLVAELEKVKSECAQLTQTNSDLRGSHAEKMSMAETMAVSLQTQLKQMKEFQAKTADESSQLTEQLTVAQKAREQLEAQLETASKAQTSLSEENTKLQGLLEQTKSQSTPDTSSQVTSQLESQLSAITAAKVQLQSELTTLKEKLSDKEVETSRLMEENERLSEQVASSVERPAAEGEEAVNGHSEVNHTQQKVVAKEVPASSDLEEQYSKLTIQLKQRESRCEELETELSDNKLELQKLQSKNDEVSAAYEQYKAECMSMLGNLFPADCTASESLATIQTKASQFIQDLEKKAGDASRVESLLEDIQKLETQSVSYKTILSQTENMLTTLQSSVEGAELEWKKKLETSQSECSDLKKKVGEMESKNSELLAKLKDTSSLSEQLTAEKSSKDQLAKKCSELQQLLALGEKQLQLSNSQEEVLTNGGGETEA